MADVFQSKMQFVVKWRKSCSCLLYCIDNINNSENGSLKMVRLFKIEDLFCTQLGLAMFVRVNPRGP